MKPSAGTSAPGLMGVSQRVRGLDRVPSKATSDQVAARAAQGGEVLALYGAPYWLPPDHVRAAAVRAVTDRAGAPSSGVPELRSAIAHKLERDNAVLADPEREILVTNAAMHALSIIFATMLDPGDEVVMFSPGFFFSGLIELAGGVPVSIKTRQEEDWRWDVAALERAISARTKLIVINTPGNPTGYVASEADLIAVAELARRHNLLVVSDEAYDTMLYDGARHLSLASLPGARERTISVFSFTKSYAMKQWRVGYIVSPAGLTPYLRNVLEWNLLACNHVAQRAAQAALEGPQEWVREVGTRYQRCRDLMADGLRSVPGISFVVPQGAPFLFLDISGLGISGIEFARTLLEDDGIPTDPGVHFGSDVHVRLPFGGEEDVVREAAHRISTAAGKIVRNRR